MNESNSNGRRNFIIGIICLIAAFVIAKYIQTNLPQASREKPAASVLQVNTITAKRQDYNIIIKSYGTVQARTRGTLNAQVAGEIIEITEKFQDGQFFEKGELLLQIDDRNYQAALSNAKAQVSQAQSKLALEKAQADQAEQDWKRLGNTKRAPAMVRREPQLAAAISELESSKAALALAQLNVDRTTINAPYAGRLINKHVDIGQYVTMGAVLGEIFAIDVIEVNLPLSNREYAQLDINENYRTVVSLKETLIHPEVTIENRIGTSIYKWPGFISRSSATVNNETRQISVIAQINDPYKHRDDNIPPLKIGQFVTAKIKGKRLQDIFIIPNEVILQGRYIYKVVDNAIIRSEIEVFWQDDENAIIQDGLESGDVIVSTAIGEIISGTKVEMISSDEF